MSSAFCMALCVLLCASCSLIMNDGLVDSLKEDVSTKITFFFDDPATESKPRSAQIKYEIGSRALTASFPTYEKTDAVIYGWKYYKNPVSGSTDVPGNVLVDEQGLVISFTVTPQPAYFVAQWKDVCTVTFETFGGTFIDSQIVDVGSYSYEPGETPYKNGYLFNGWYTSDDGGATLSAPYDFTKPVTQNITLYASWTLVYYTINYELSGGECQDFTLAQSYTVEDTVVLPGEGQIVYGSHEFSGWRVGGTDEYITEIQPGTYSRDLYLIAEWDTTIVGVTYVDYDGEVFTKRTRTNNPPGNPLESYYAKDRGDLEFDGWYTDSEYIFRYDVDNLHIYDDITLYAKWVHMYTVTYIGRDGTSVLATKQVKEGDSAKEPENIERTDGEYMLWDWFSDSECTTWASLWDGIYEDKTFYSKWEKIRTFTFYKKDSSSDCSTWHIKYGDDAWLPNAMTCFGYTENATEFFLGWATTPNAATVEYDSNYHFENVTEDRTFYAVWTTEYYIFTLVSTYDTSESKQVKVGKNSVVQLDNFDVWSFTRPGGFEPGDCSESATALRGDIGRWEEIRVTSDKTYYLYFKKNIIEEFNGGSGSNMWRECYYGETPTAPDDPWREHYTFDGWYTQASGGTRITDPTTVTITADTTYYAHWTSNSTGGSTIKLIRREGIRVLEKVFI